MVWETATGALLSASLQVLFDRLASRQLLDFFRIREFDETLLQRLKITLLSVYAVLSDAEEKQITNSFVNEWVHELKDAAYHAEDFLDEISTMALQFNVEVESQATNKEVRNSISRLEKVASRLEHMAKYKDILGLKESLGRTPSPRLPTTSLVDECEVYGRDIDKRKIKSFLLSNRACGKEIPVMAILGPAGVGKTTLAQLLYNDSDVTAHFLTRIWAYVSEQIDVFKLTKTIFEAVTSLPCKITDLNVIQVNLKEKLARKRFLLVLDDVWNEDFMIWDLLQKTFRDADNGSRIIMTTRSQSVATIMHAVIIHPLRPLSDEDCSLVFKKHAFRGENNNAHPNLKIIGEEIVKKCKGLPLAAKTLGSLLYSNGEAHEWNKILKSKIWDLPIDKSNILPSLRLSYYYLPPHLKQCFAYCSIFPKGYVFEKEKLVLLWMAEGFLQQPRSEKRMEEVGHEYFHELLSRSFFQRLRSNESCFIMHDLINELAQFVSGEFCFKFCGGKSHGISEKARHFSYIRDQIDVIEKYETLHELKFLRTFLPLSFSSNPGGSLSLNKMVIEDLILTRKFLRVLSLCHYEISELPDSFDNLKHLRYLDLSRTRIERLPQSTCCLYNLQTLMLSNCFNLIELPENMRNLIKLAHLDVSGTKLKKMPQDFGRLKNLRTLTTFVVGIESGISELGGLLDLQGKLSILELQNVEEAADAEAAKLKDKKNIKELVFSWSISCPDVVDLEKEICVIEKLRPPENIEKLTIKNYGGTAFPSWLGNSSFSNMVFLSLTDCKNCSSLSTLGQLSSLQKLHIANMVGLESISAEFYTNGTTTTNPFKSLRSLHFEELPNWKQWFSFADDGGEFPSLQELHIRNCQELVGNLPKYLPSLTLLHIEDCKSLKFSFGDTTGYAELQTLHIIGCDSLENFPFGFFGKLKCLQIQNCNQLKHIEVPNDLQQELKFLGDLEISDCSNLESFSGRGLPAPNLTSFSVSNCRSLKSLPEQMYMLLTSLKILSLSSCPMLESFENGGLPPNLGSLFITNCDHLTPQKDWGLSKMGSLTLLTITGGCSNLKSFPEEGLLPASLISLQVSEFPELEILDLKGLQSLTSLKTLEINSCVSLHGMSDGRLPESLSFLIINECPLLKPRCQREQGDHRDKIYHIPNVEIYD